MLDAASKAFFNTLARSRTLHLLTSRYASAGPRSVARRFIAGETIEDAIDAARRLADRGLKLTLDYLGESAPTRDEADRATREYRHIVEQIARAGIERNLSIKLTQLGLDVDRATCIDNMRRILEPAVEHGFFIRVDMEGSAYTEQTLEICQTLWSHDYRNIGVVLQSCLLRSERDLESVVGLGMRVRLVKGAYREPKSIAYQQKADVDAAYVRMMRTLLDRGTYPAFGTHDEAIIRDTRQYAAERRRGADTFEFQMLYGIRRDLQASLVAEGQRMRVYVPFGRQWFPYFMRRLGERPANVGFVLRGVLHER
jgi:proline dehydrogenase